MVKNHSKKLRESLCEQFGDDLLFADSFDDAIESRIPREVVESEEFQEGLNIFYNQNKDNITIPEKSKLSPFTNQLQSFGYEVSGGVGLGIATAPMLKAGVPGVVLYAITNGIGNYLLNEEVIVMGDPPFK